MNYFESTYRLYKEYQKVNGIHPVDGYNVGYTIDGLEILEQMDYLYEKAMTANEYLTIENEKLTKQFMTWREYCLAEGLDYLEFMKEKSSEIPKLSNHTESTRHLFEAKLFAEMFYYKGFRLRNIIRYSGGLGKAFECEGIRNVRNLLIEHPEKSDFVYIHSFALGIPEIGPVIKSGKPENDIKFKDKGLVKNAFEFKNNFENMLSDFLNK